MTEQELREKIILCVKEAISNNITFASIGIAEIDCNEFDHIAEYVADALIAAGIGDVKEAERRAARAERALNDCVEYYSWSGLCPVLGCNYNKACWQKKCTSDIAQCFKIQAEKELAEEGKE